MDITSAGALDFRRVDAADLDSRATLPTRHDALSAANPFPRHARLTGSPRARSFPRCSCRTPSSKMKNVAAIKRSARESLQAPPRRSYRRAGRAIVYTHAGGDDFRRSSFEMIISFQWFTGDGRRWSSLGRRHKVVREWAVDRALITTVSSIC